MGFEGVWQCGILYRSWVIVEDKLRIGTFNTNLHSLQPKYEPFQPFVSSSTGAIAGLMETANPSMPHGAVAVGHPGLVQPLGAAAFLKHPRTPPGGLGLEY